MSEGEVRLLPPWYDFSVSVNGHLRQYSLAPDTYARFLQEEEIDPLNIAEVWLYFSNHLLEYVIQLTEEFGAIDPDGVKLIAVSINAITAPEGVDAVLNCDECTEGYREAISEYTDEGDDDD